MTEEEAAQLIEAAEYLAGMEAVLAMLSEEQIDALLEMEALQPGIKMWIASLYGKTIQ